jgi:hypothetical protein
MWFKGKKTAKEKGKKLFPSFANSMGQSCWQSWAFFPAKHASFSKRVPLPTSLSSGFANNQNKLLAKP